MDVADLLSALPAILFTLLAIVLANAIFGNKATRVPPSGAQSERCERGREADAAERLGAERLREDGATPAQRPGPQVKDAGVRTSCPGRRVSGEAENAEGSPEVVSEAQSPKTVPEAQTAFLKTTALAHDPVHGVDVISGPVPAVVARRHLSLERDVFLHRLPDAEVHKPSPDSDSEPALEPEDDLAALEEKLSEYSPENEDEEDMIAVGMEAEDLSLRYALGKLTTNQLEEMTKEEMEEERRIEFTTDFTSL